MADNKLDNVRLGDLKTVSLKGVEIMAAGTWFGEKGGKQTWTVKDLKELVAAHKAATKLGAYATVYLGHNDNPDDPEKPAVGYIENMYVRGGKLLADLSDVPALLAKLIELKAYRGRSIEGYRTDIRRGFVIAGQKFRQVVTGLALLGKNLPAVDTLEDIADLHIAASALSLASGEFDEDASIRYPVRISLALTDPVAEPETPTDAAAEEPLAGDFGFGAVELMNAIRQLLMDLWKYDAQGDKRGWLDVCDIYPDELQAVANFDGKRWVVPYQVDGGKVSVGTPVPARAVYVPIAMAASSEMTPEQRKSALAKAMVVLEELDGIMALIAGKRDAPVVRLRIRALKQDFRRIAGADLVQNQREDSMDKLRIALGLPEGATPEQIVDGIALAVANTADPAVAMAVLAEILGMPDADPGQIVAKVRELAGKAPEGSGDSAGTDTPPADAGTEGGMGMGKDKGTRATTPPADDTVTVSAAEFAALRKQVSDVMERSLERDKAEAQSQAERLADDAIAAGKYLPQQRDDLIILAKLDPERVRKLADGQPKVVRYGVQGSPGKSDAAGTDVTETREFEVMTEKMGITPDDAKTALTALQKSRQPAKAN